MSFPFGLPFLGSLRLAKSGPSLQKKGAGTPREPVRYGRRETDHPPTVARLRQLYERPTSFTNYLPWLDYDPTTKVFLLEDGRSVAALFELRPAGTEARPPAWLADLRDKAQGCLTGALPESEAPWVLQLFIQDEARLDRLTDDLIAYARPDVRASALSTAWFEGMRIHLAELSRPGGLFVDERITGGPWQGKQRRVRACLYQRRPLKSSHLRDHGQSVDQQLNEVAARFTTSLESTGIGVTRLGGQDLYLWLFRWFNPHPGTTEGDVEALLKLAPYPGDDQTDRPYGYDLSEMLMQGLPRYHPQKGLWWFDDRPHRCLTVQTLANPPEVGQFTAERSMGKHIFAVFDRFPPDTLMAMTITVVPQDLVRNHLARVEHKAFGDYAEAQLAGQDAKLAQFEIVKGNKLFPVQTLFYLRGEDEADLKQRTHQVRSLLLSNGLRPIDEAQDLCALDTYVRGLPMAFDPAFDKRYTHRSRLTFSRHIANLAPFYGRSVGTGHPALLFFNRGGEPLALDPIRDRKANAHGLILGPTGSGKSALLVYFILQMLATHRPRIFLVESGNSFGLLGQYLAAQGLSVHQVSISPDQDVRLPPFADALRLLETAEQALQRREEVDPSDPEHDDPTDERRDILGEMEIAARIMVTGGDPREDDRLTRPNRLLLREALLEAARQVQARGGDQVLPEDVVQALRCRTDLTENRRERAQEMADAMALFCTPGSLEAHLFNRPGKLWPEADVTLVDLGLLAREGYEDKLTVAYIGLVNRINALLERDQHRDRPTIFLTDEAHVVTTNPLLAPYMTKGTKMWRKLGAWLWLATQNLQDFPDAAKRMLNMMEWWVCMSLPPEEVEHVARFKELTAEERALLLAASKEPGKYVEGVILSPALKALFRNVPPALALALAQTEQDEKAVRAKLMAERHCSELDAALIVADRIAQQRREAR